jgi:uncharacterized protein (DUF952 family)
VNQEGAALLYHLAVKDEWDDAVGRGAAYERSTLGRSLDSEGFIHCSFASQVQQTADAFFRDRDDVVLLTIDPSRVDSDIRVEAVGGADERFPHIYGPLSLDSVMRTDEVPMGDDGRLLVAVFLDAH